MRKTLLTVIAVATAVAALAPGVANAGIFHHRHHHHHHHRR